MTNDVIDVVDVVYVVDVIDVVGVFKRLDYFSTVADVNRIGYNHRLAAWTLPTFVI
jgi:hypothetical protein